MDKDACRKILDELAQEVLAEDSPLCWMIARELADFTVAFIVANDGQLSPAGTGTLVSYRDSHYFLTAAHVWEKKLRVSDWIRIPLKENSPCRFAISPNEIISCGAPIPARWNEWGPDITLLRIPPERVGSFTAVGRPFYPLSMKRELRIDCGFETTFLMGAPALRGKFSTESAIPELQGMNVLLDTGLYSSTELSDGFRSRSRFSRALRFGRISELRPYLFAATDRRVYVLFSAACTIRFRRRRSSNCIIVSVFFTNKLERTPISANGY